MIVCLVFVFSSLIEYAFVNVLSRRTAGRRRAPPPAPGQSTAAANATTSTTAGSPSALAPAVQSSHGVSTGAVILRSPEYRPELLIPAFAFSAEAGTYLPTPEGWKAELDWDGWLVTYQNKCPAPGIEPGCGRHLSTNRTRRKLTSLTNPLSENILLSLLQSGCKRGRNRSK